MCISYVCIFQQLNSYAMEKLAQKITRDRAGMSSERRDQVLWSAVGEQSRQLCVWVLDIRVRSKAEDTYTKSQTKTFIS